jgi:uncharacterized membrane protein YgaE (UPF0421/DUF939 family)
MQLNIDKFRALIERLDWKIAIRVGIAAIAAWSLGILFTKLFDRPDRLASGLWTTLTAIIVLQAYLGGTYMASWNRFLGVLIGSITGGFFTSLFGSSPLSLGISIALTIMFCSILNLKESYRISSVSAAVVMILWGFSEQVSPWVFSFFRFIDSCLGILIAMVVAHTVWPTHVTKKLRADMGTTLRKLNQLYRMVFIIEAQEESYQALVKDIDDHLVKNRELLDILKPELMLKSQHMETWSILTTDTERLFESIISLGSAYSQSTRSIFDINLSNYLMEVMDQSNTAFRDVALMIEAEKKDDPSYSLALTLKQLKEEQLRFRAANSTRQYSLDAVENFFVFFYAL